MCDRLQDSPQSLKAHGDVQQMRGEEEVVKVAHHREAEVPQRVEEGVVCDRDARFPHLVAPVDVDDAEICILFDVNSQDLRREK